MLRILDQRWRDHLYSMDYLKEGIHLRAMGQKNPLTEWQREGFEMFETMMDSCQRGFCKVVSHIEISDNPKTDNEKNTLDQSQNVQYSGTDEIASGTLAAISSNKATGALMDNAPTVVEENKSVKQRL